MSPRHRNPSLWAWLRRRRREPGFLPGLPEEDEILRQVAAVRDVLRDMPEISHSPGDTIDSGYRDVRGRIIDPPAPLPGPDSSPEPDRARSPEATPE